MTHQLPDTSVGLGFRREIADGLLALQSGDIDFFEVAPENWIGVGGKYARQFRELSERFPITLHGLSLDIGGIRPIDFELVDSIREFIAQHNCLLYSEHLSYCADGGHLYDLMPIPFREDALRRVVERIQQVQDRLGQRIVLENVSYYARIDAGVDSEMTELEFIREVLERADCQMLLDVNNVFVNSINHCYNPIEFMSGLPAERVQYMHIAGHFVEAEDLRVDTHGAEVCTEVWELLDTAYQLFGARPTLLERDFNFPPVTELLDEASRIQRAQSAVVPGLAKAIPENGQRA